MRVSNHVTKWTPEQDAELMRMRDEEGMHFAAIAEQLGRPSISSVEARYRRLRSKSK